MKRSTIDWQDSLGGLTVGKGRQVDYTIHKRSAGFLLRVLEKGTRDLATRLGIKGGPVQHGFVSADHARNRCERIERSIGEGGRL